MSVAYGCGDFSPPLSSRSSTSTRMYRSQNGADPIANHRYHPKTSSALNRKWVHRSVGDLTAESNYYLSHPRLQAQFYRDLYKKYPRAFQRRQETREIGRSLFNAKPHVRFEDELELQDDRSDMSLRSTRSERPITNWDKEVGHYIKSRSRSRECLTSAEPSESGRSALSVKQRLRLNSQTLNRLLNEKSPLRQRFATDNEGGDSGMENDEVRQITYSGKENQQRNTRQKVLQRHLDDRRLTGDRYRSRSELGLGRNMTSRTVLGNYSPSLIRDLSQERQRNRSSHVDSIMTETDLKIDTLLEQLSMKIWSPDSPPDSAIDVDTPSIQSLVSTDRGGYSEITHSVPGGSENNSNLNFSDGSSDLPQRNSEQLKAVCNFTGSVPQIQDGLHSVSQKSVFLGEYAFSEDGGATTNRAELRTSQQAMSSSERSESDHSSFTSHSDEALEMDKIVQNFVHAEDQVEISEGPGQGLLQFYMDISQDSVDMAKQTEAVAMDTCLSHDHELKSVNEIINSNIQSQLTTATDAGKCNSTETMETKIYRDKMTAEVKKPFQEQTIDSEMDADDLKMAVNGTQSDRVNIENGTQPKTHYQRDSDVDSGIGQSSTDSKQVAVINRKGRPKARETTPKNLPVKANHSILPSRDDLDSCILDEVNLSELSHGLSRDLYGRKDHSKLEDERDDTDPRHGISKVSKEEEKLAERYRRHRSPSPFILRHRRFTSPGSRPSSVSSIYSADLDVRVVDISLSNEKSEECSTEPSVEERLNRSTKLNDDYDSDLENPRDLLHTNTDDVFPTELPVVVDHSLHSKESQQFFHDHHHHQNHHQQVVSVTELQNVGTKREEKNHCDGSANDINIHAKDLQSCQASVAMKDDMFIERPVHENLHFDQRNQSSHRSQTVDNSMSSTPVQHRKHSLSSCSYSVSSVASSGSLNSNPSVIDRHPSTEHMESESGPVKASGIPNDKTKYRQTESRLLQMQQRVQTPNRNFDSSSVHTDHSEFETDSSTSSIGKMRGKFKPSVTSPRVQGKTKKLRNIFKNKKGSYNPAGENFSVESGQHIPHHVTFSDTVPDEQMTHSQLDLSNSEISEIPHSIESISDDVDPGYATVGSLRNSHFQTADFCHPKETIHGNIHQISGEVTVHTQSKITPYELSLMASEQEPETLDEQKPHVVSAKPVYISLEQNRRNSIDSKNGGSGSSHQQDSQSDQEVIENRSNKPETSSLSCDETMATEVPTRPVRTKKLTNTPDDHKRASNGSQKSGAKDGPYSSIEEVQQKRPEENPADLYSKIDPSMKRKPVSNKTQPSEIEEGPPLPDRQYESNLEKMKGVSASKSSLMGGLKSVTKGKFKALRKAMSLEKGLEQTGTGGHKQRSTPGGAFNKDSNSGGMKKAPSLKSLTSLFSRKKKKKGKMTAEEMDTVSSERPSQSSSISGGLRPGKKQQWASCHTLTGMDSSNHTQPRGKLLQLNSDGTQLIELTKPSEGPIGFFIAQGNAQYNNGIFVSRFREGGTEKLFSGLLNVGDEILEINGHFIRDLTLDAVYSLMGASLTLQLKVFPLMIRRDV